MTKPRYDSLSREPGSARLPLELAPAPGVAGHAGHAAAGLDGLREDFPILSQTARGHRLVYLDNAATTQKPRQVIEAVRRYYESENANIHRGVYHLSEQATAMHDAARRKVQRFLNAADSREIVFTRGTTESINLVAATYGRRSLREGDEILISAMEHHSNIVPWQMLCEQTGARLRVIPFNSSGELMIEEYEKLLSPRTKLVSVVHVSNSLGTINPVRRIIELARRQGAVVLVDGAQWVAHSPTDVRALDCDFYAFSGHKLFGPTGIGVLYGKARLLEAMPPYQGGGDMIASVTFEKTIYNEIPHKFEAGTPHIAGAIGLGAAIDYISQVGLERIAAHEADLLAYATEKLSQVPGLRIIGTARHKAAVVSFVFEDPPMSPQDVGMKLDLAGIAIRTGHHCCQPVMDRFAVSGTARASFAFYNTRNDIDRLAHTLHTIAEAHCRNIVCPQVAADFPAAAAPSPAAVAADLNETFELLEDWPERYQYLIELGEKLPAMPAEMKTDANRVHGCQSTVHISARVRPGTDQVLDFLADSDADIVRGLIAILQRLFSGQQACEILNFDVQGFFRHIGLDQHLSLTRRNGLHGMVMRIRTLAAEVMRGVQCGDATCPLRTH